MNDDRTTYYSVTASTSKTYLFSERQSREKIANASFRPISLAASHLKHFTERVVFSWRHRLLINLLSSAFINKCRWQEISSTVPSWLCYWTHCLARVDSGEARLPKVTALVILVKTSFLFIFICSFFFSTCNYSWKAVHLSSTGSGWCCRTAWNVVLSSGTWCGIFDTEVTEKSNLVAGEIHWQLGWHIDFLRGATERRHTVASLQCLIN